MKKSLWSASVIFVVILSTLEGCGTSDSGPGADDHGWVLGHDMSGPELMDSDTPPDSEGPSDMSERLDMVAHPVDQHADSGELTVCEPTYEVSPNDALSGLSGCQVIEGSVSLTFASVEALPQALSEIREIRGLLVLREVDQLRSLEPLNELRLVTQRVLLDHLPHLTSLGALSHLTVVEGEFSISATGLTSLEGLESLRRVGGLRLNSNRDLVSLKGLEGLEHIAGDLSIHGTPVPMEQIDALLERIRLDGEVSFSQTP